MFDHNVTWMTGSEQNNDDAVHRTNVWAKTPHEAELKMKLEVKHGYNFHAWRKR